MRDILFPYFDNRQVFFFFQENRKKDDQKMHRIQG